MPNGGHPPSCVFCKWGTRKSNPRYSVGIDCQRHQISIDLAVATFCPDLAGADSSGLEKFIAHEHLSGDSVYVWNDIDDPSRGYTALASIATYGNWSAEQVEEALRTAQRSAQSVPARTADAAQPITTDSDIAEQLEIARRFGKVIDADPIIADDEFRSVSELPDPPTRTAFAICFTSVAQLLPEGAGVLALRQLSQYLPSIERRVLGPVAALGAAIELRKEKLDALGPDTRGKSREELESIAKSMDPNTAAELDAVVNEIAEAAKGADPVLLERCKQESITARETYGALYIHLDKQWRARRGGTSASTPSHPGEHRRPKSGCLLSILAMLGAAAMGVLIAR